MDEYHNFRDSPQLRFIAEATTLDKTLAFMPNTIDKNKIFLDEQVFILIGSYFGVAARLCFYIQNICKGSPSNDSWHNDIGVLRFCSSVLHDEEMKVFLAEKWQTSKLFGVIENKITTHLKRLCLVEDIVNDTISTKIKTSHSIQEIYNEISTSRATN